MINVRPAKRMLLKAEAQWKKIAKRIHLAGEVVKDPIIIYQFGKVGSSSMSSSLRGLKLKAPVHSFHYLNRIEEIETYRKNNWAKTDSDYINKCKKFRDLLSSTTNVRWNLISGVREPIAHSISFYFENAPQKFDDYEEMMRSPQRLEEFIRRFRLIYPEWLWWYSNWFDDQLRDVFGIDVYATQFHKSQGYTIYYGETAQLLLIRQENLTAVWETAIQEFLKIQNCKLHNVNSSKDKNYGIIYEEFLKRIEIPHDLINQAYDSNLARHFYTQEEIQEFRTSWGRNR